jgi:hypothetical protein
MAASVPGIMRLTDSSLTGIDVAQGKSFQEKRGARRAAQAPFAR